MLTLRSASAWQSCPSVPGRSSNRTVNSFMVGIIEPPYGVPRGKGWAVPARCSVAQNPTPARRAQQGPACRAAFRKKVFPNDVLKRFSHSRPELGYRDVRCANSRSISPVVRAACLALVGRPRPPGRAHLCPGRSHEPQGLRTSAFSRRTRPKAIVQRGPVRNPPFFKDGPADTAGSSETGARRAAAAAPLLCFVSRHSMPRGTCPATAVWHSHGNWIAGTLARRESGSPIAHPHQQRDTPAAYQDVLPGSLATRRGGSAACRPKLFL